MCALMVAPASCSKTVVLPEMIDHRKQASRQAVIEGSFPIRQLQRFGSLLADQAGEVHLRLAFSKGDGGQTHVEGQLETNVTLICQLCMQPVATQLVCELAVDIVSSAEQMDALSFEQDGMVHEDRLIPVAALVEDELMLSVPMIPQHGEGGCPETEYTMAREDAQTSREDTQTHRPFARLADALGQNKKPEN